jgi:putative ABC transport system ATP-binding protein
MSQFVLEAEGLTKQLKVGEVTVDALKGVSLKVAKGEFVAVIGPSGSGKSTLLGLMGGLDSPTTGKIAIDGVDITKMSERELTRIRNEKIGFIFQSFNLIPTLSALENVALPMQFARQRVAKNPTSRAKELLELLGLGDRLANRPSQLSGGQQQRVAIARALANNPPLLLADEPTGNLDTASSDIVMNAFRSIQKTIGTTIIIVTHDMDIASQAERVITIVDGLVADDKNLRAQIQRDAVNAFREKHQTGELPKLEV